MYYQITLKIPKIKGELVEEFLYQYISQGWETIENESKYIFNIFLKIILWK